MGQPGVGLESAYSDPRIELEHREIPPPFCTLVVVVVWGGGLEGGTRLGCVRGTLGAICFIARFPP